ncbi:MAG: molybdate ABC transporter substrate-binding protein, partial [Alphaproteobacteria bacterium]|nr:molybdate ABC transporter substrate-binding protein [Alphaproteobacteria bacterium]
MPTNSSANGARAILCRSRRWSCWLVLALLALYGSPVAALNLRLAVASNLAGVAPKLVAEFNQQRRLAGEPEVTIDLSFAATGVLFAQIVNGAPFDLFLSADREPVAELVGRGRARPEDRVEFATGILVLYSRDRVVNAESLKPGDFQHLALANPATAPFGRAAVQVLTNLKLYEGLKSRLVLGNSIAQTFEFVRSGNAELGFVALSTLHDGRESSGNFWLIPPELYSPLPQTAVILARSGRAELARGFLRFLVSPAAQGLLLKNGYG